MRARRVDDALLRVISPVEHLSKPPALDPRFPHPGEPRANFTR